MSSINPNNIDGTYPIAGQDNDSQGFRDNFTNIKNNFTFAASELADLQNNALLKSALSGTTLNNNLNNAQLIGAQISKFTQTRNDIGSQSGPITINWADAHFQTLTVTGNTSITLSQWPTSGFWTQMVLDVTPSCDNLVLTLPSSVTANTKNSIQGFSGSGVTLPKGNVAYRFEFSSYDNGSTISIRDLYRNYQGDTIIAGNLTIGGARVDSGYQYYAPSGNLAITGNININRIILDPATPTVSLYANITLPNVLVDGTIVTISSTQTVQFLSVMPSWNNTLAPFGNITLGAGNAATYFFHAIESKWYKIG
jgi:hypothetical protein